jgi:2-polyprenyl-6-methoxyphenol hydroxylase-like FAD-dependent oxidoreductase
MTTTITTRCVIAGGGPAGMMLGFLLARAGIDVVVLEKHKDFLRDFRGDTVHPSTLELIHELGLLEEFLKLPHQEVSRLTFQVGAERIPMVDFSHLPTRCKFVALMPQWDFLDFLARQGRRYPKFHLRMQTEAVDLISEGDGIVGLRAKSPDGEIDIRADLVVGCDGRHSTVRERAGLKVDDVGAPIDVLWFRLSRKNSDTEDTGGHIEAGRMMVTLYRGDYWQCAYVIPKGGIEAVKREGLAAFRERVAEIEPWLADRLGELKSFDDIKLLTVAIDRLRQWHRPGLICIGDAAHAMSPVGGVGINLAVQDAVAAANILTEPLRSGAVTNERLAAVQARREFPMKVIQRMQVIVQNNLLSPALKSSERPKPPFVMRLVQWFPALRRIPARVLGLGVRPEHIHTPERT